MGQPQRPIAAEQQILSLGSILQKLREANSVDVLIETTISYLQEQFDYKLIWIALYDRVNHILCGQGGMPANETNFLQQRVVLSPGDLFEQVVIEQRPLGVPDLQVEHRVEGWQELAIKLQIQGTIILPIRYKERCLGLVLLSSQHWGYLLTGEARARLLIVLGELGAAIYQQEMDLQQKQTKRSQEPLLKLLQNLTTLSNLDERLKAVVAATHEFVSPSDTKIYWFERQSDNFWCRMSNQLANSGDNYRHEQIAIGITVEELSDFYDALAGHKIVWIGESRSSLKSHFTAKLLERLQVRSLLASPIIWQQDLLGFLAIESNLPRIWTETDKHFVQAAAGLISLVAPTDSMESTIQQNAQLTKTQKLQQLNWYKHRCLEDIQKTTSSLVAQIHDLGIPSHELTKNRYEVLLQQLDNTTNLITGVLKLEEWELHINWDTMPIATLLKRSLERVENLVKKHQLWIGVHGLGQRIVDEESPHSSSDLNGVQTSMAIAGDIFKIELVLHELLVSACERSHHGGRIDIWCRRLRERTLDLSITDNGTIEAQLLTELRPDTPKDVLACSTLNQPPGLHLLICQQLMEQLQGELHFYQLPDNRVVSRLLLLLAIEVS